MDSFPLKQIVGRSSGGIFALFRVATANIQCLYPSMLTLRQGGDALSVFPTKKCEKWTDPHMHRHTWWPLYTINFHQKEKGILLYKWLLLLTHGGQMKTCGKLETRISLPTFPQFGQFPLMPMGVLAPMSAHAGPSAQPLIDVSGNFPAHVFAELPSNISPNPSEVISEISELHDKTF